MSWSKSSGGAIALIIAAMAAWKPEVEAMDRSVDGIDEKIVELHGAQVDRAVQTATRALDGVQDGYGASVSCNGHAGVSGDQVTADNVQVSVSVYKLTPPPAAPAEPAAAASAS